LSPDARPSVGPTILRVDCTDVNQHCLVAEVAALRFGALEEIGFRTS
jgi:hypothetical protein